MKKIFLISLLVFTVVSVSVAQGNDKAKNKEKSGNKEKTQKVKDADQAAQKAEKEKHNKTIWEGTADNGGGPKPSKNQPAKVRQAFKNDYPLASNVNWSKYRGDWTATFRNGLGWSTAVYHANGNRKDTRTLIPRVELPIKIEDIFKKRPDTRLEDVIKIEVPQTVKDIFRIKTIVNNTAQYLFYNKDGEQVQYDY